MGDIIIHTGRYKYEVSIILPDIHQNHKVEKNEVKIPKHKI